MGCEAGRCNKTSTPLGIFIVKLANQGSFSPWGKTNPAGHEPSISMSCGNIKKIPALFIIKLWTKQLIKKQPSSIITIWIGIYDITYISVILWPFLIISTILHHYTVTWNICINKHTYISLQGSFPNFACNKFKWIN